MKVMIAPTARRRLAFGATTQEGDDGPRVAPQAGKVEDFFVFIFCGSVSIIFMFERNVVFLFFF